MNMKQDRMRELQASGFRQQTEEAWIRAVVAWQKHFPRSWVKGDEWSFEWPHEGSPNTGITCPVMTVFNVDKLGGGHWTPQPPKPQHAWTQHANDLLVLDQLRTNHSARTDWTVERLKVSISDAFRRHTEAEPPWMERIELARHTVHCQESWVHYLPVTWQRRDDDEDV